MKENTKKHKKSAPARKIMGETAKIIKKSAPARKIINETAKYQEKIHFFEDQKSVKTHFQEVPRPPPRVTHMFSDPRKAMGRLPGPENGQNHLPQPPPWRMENPPTTPPPHIQVMAVPLILK